MGKKKTEPLTVEEIIKRTVLATPITYRGNQRLWDISDEVIEAALGNTKGGKPC